MSGETSRLNPCQDRLALELKRLYGCSSSDPESVNSSLSRALVLELARPGDWSLLAPVWKTFANDWKVPPPAIAVNGVDGIQLWFSVSTPLRGGMGSQFLEALVAYFLSDVSADRIVCMPMRAAETTNAGPTFHAIPENVSGTDRWSAFITRDLAAVFGEEPWVDVPPQRDQQAEILSRLGFMSPDQFDYVLAKLNPKTGMKNEDRSLVQSRRQPVEAVPAVIHDTDMQLTPAEFLRAAMNNPQLPMSERIAAASALLPYS